MLLPPEKDGLSKEESDDQPKEGSSLLISIREIADDSNSVQEKAGTDDQSEEIDPEELNVMYQLNGKLTHHVRFQFLFFLCVGEMDIEAAPRTSKI